MAGASASFVGLGTHGNASNQLIGGGSTGVTLTSASGNNAKIFSLGDVTQKLAATVRDQPKTATCLVAASFCMRRS